LAVNNGGADEHRIIQTWGIGSVPWLKNDGIRWVARWGVGGIVVGILPGIATNGNAKSARAIRRGIGGLATVNGGAIYRLTIHRLSIYRLTIYRLTICRLTIYRLPIHRLAIYGRTTAGIGVHFKANRNCTGGRESRKGCDRPQHQRGYPPNPKRLKSQVCSSHRFISSIKDKTCMGSDPVKLTALIRQVVPLTWLMGRIEPTSSG
jgi:hypothetical protein